MIIIIISNIKLIYNSLVKLIFFQIYSLLIMGFEITLSPDTLSSTKRGFCKIYIDTSREFAVWMIFNKLC